MKVCVVYFQISRNKKKIQFVERNERFVDTSSQWLIAS